MAARIVLLLVLVAAVAANNDDLERVDEPVQVCYYDSRAVDRSQPWQLKPQDIKPQGCTHLVYTFVNVKKSGELTHQNPNRMQEDLKAIWGLRGKHGDLQIMVGIECFDSGFNNMLKDNLDTFVDNLVTLVNEHELDGVDFGTHLLGRNNDQKVLGFTAKMREIIKKLRDNGVGTITGTYNPVGLVSDKSQHDMVKDLIRDFDILHLAFYDFDVYMIGMLTHHTSLEHIKMVMKELDLIISDANDTDIKFGKITFGFATFGRILKLKSPEATNIGNASNGTGPKGNITQTKGMLSTFGICSRLKHMTVKMIDAIEAPIAFDDKYWISFDNIQSMKKKLEVVKRYKMKGVSIWSVDVDDFIEKCEDEQKTLPKKERVMTIKDIGTFLRRKLLTVGVIPEETDEVPEDISSLTTTENGPIVRSCYYDSKARTLTKGVDVLSLDKIQADLCTHIVYALDHSVFDAMEPTLSQEILKDLNLLMGLKAANPELKIMIGLKEVPQLLMITTKVSKFIVSIIKPLALDGIDLYLKEWDILSSTNNLHIPLKGFLKTIRTLNVQPTFLLTVTLDIKEEYADNIFRLRGLETLVDWMNIMTFDFVSAKIPTVQHHTDLLRTQRIINLLISGGINPDMLVMGLSPYGRTFKLADKEKFSPEAEHMGFGKPGQIRGEIGKLTRYEMCGTKFNIRRDDKVGVPYGHLDDQWVSFDDEESLRQKINFALEKKLRGVFIWTIDQDDYLNHCGKGNFPFLVAIKAILEKRGTTVVETVPQEETAGQEQQQQEEKQEAVKEEIEQKVQEEMQKPMTPTNEITVCYGVGIWWYMPFNEALCSAFCSENMCSPSFCYCP